MAYSPCMIFVQAANQADMNAVWTAMGRGAPFLRKCCAIDPNATDQTPATHFVTLDESATLELEQTWRAMIDNQDLPEIAGTWGEDGIISAQDAQAVLASGNWLFSHVGDFTAEQDLAWQNGCFATLGIQFVPDPEF